MTFLERGAAWLEGMRISHLASSSSFTYLPHDGAAYGITNVTVGAMDRRPETGPEDAVLLNIQTTEFLIPTDQLRRAPCMEDRIQETQGNNVYRYRVTKHSSQPGHYYHDLNRNCYRVFTTRETLNERPNNTTS